MDDVTLTPVAATQPSTKASLITMLQGITGNKEPDSAVLFAMYLNQSQRDVEAEFPDHPSLQASKQITLTAGVDAGYSFADDFRKERYLRIITPINDSQTLYYQDYVQLRDQLQSDVAFTIPGIPQRWYWAPEDPNQIHVWPMPDQAYTLQYDYIRYAPDLTSDGDTPFFDRLYHVILVYRSLFYYYCSDSIARPDKGGMWNGMYEQGLNKLRKDEQRRQLQVTRMPYGTGVNERL